MFKEQKGITLVALVITIIVLLILAGVSISLVVGEEGVLGRAQTAVSSTEQGTADQEIQLSIAEAQMAYMQDWTGNQAVQKIDYYADHTFYDRNCASAKQNVTILRGKQMTNITGPDTTGKYAFTETAATGWVTIKYISKSNVMYVAHFDTTKPTSTYKMIPTIAPDPLPTPGSVE